MWYLWLALLILHVVLVQGLVNLHQLVSKKNGYNMKPEQQENTSWIFITVVQTRAKAKQSDHNTQAK